MKRAVLIGLALLLVPHAYAQTETVLPRMGVGLFGGVNIPVVQDDQENGSVFGIRGRFKVVPILVLEPNLTFSRYGSPENIEGVDFGIEGSKLLGYGLDVTLGGAPGEMFKSFAVLGIGGYSLTNDDTGFDETGIGYRIGFGVGVAVVRELDIDLRALGLVIPQEVGGSKKSALILGGLTYNF